MIASLNNANALFQKKKLENKILNLLSKSFNIQKKRYYQICNIMLRFTSTNEIMEDKIDKLILKLIWVKYALNSFPSNKCISYYSKTKLNEKINKQTSKKNELNEWNKLIASKNK